MAEESPEEKRKVLLRVYTEIFVDGFADKYGETWEEEPFWKAVEVFKVKTKEIGIENPFDVLGKNKHNPSSYEMVRDRLKAGPHLLARKNWTSPAIGEKVAVLGLLDKLHHISGSKFEGKEDIVVLEFWATWCGPCTEPAPVLSELAERHAGRVAVIGINNDGPTKNGKDDVQSVQAFVEERKDKFRYMSYVDNAENFARDSLFERTGYKFYPGLILVVGGTVKYAGHKNWLHGHLEEALKT